MKSKKQRSLGKNGSQNTQMIGPKGQKFGDPVRKNIQKIMMKMVVRIIEEVINLMEGSKMMMETGRMMMTLEVVETKEENVDLTMTGEKVVEEVEVMDEEEEDGLKEEDEVMDEEVVVEEDEVEEVILVTTIVAVTLVDVTPAKVHNVLSGSLLLLLLLVVVVAVVVEDLTMVVDVDEFHSVLGLERGEGRVKFNRGGVH